ncbi:MAG: tRNA glutamyl-Q(34) synthetase GluQRS [Phycisphaerales bacterium]|nr:tRNA glutamyl-Q(34) synthetase GluQRS [Phycisphaerales bacterium]
MLANLEHHGLPGGATSAEVTRLAPSPTGALHLGNARTFLANWAMARRSGWRIVMRIEDLDTTRTKPGAAAEILSTLRWLGIDWDLPGRGGAYVQSHDLEPYRAAMRRLAAGGGAYPCALTRTQVEQAVSAPQEGAHDVPFSRHLRPEPREYDFDAVQGEAGPGGTNWRFAIPDRAPGVSFDAAFDDAIAGVQRLDLAQSVGDFVLWTKRDQPSYQLAVAVDDHRHGVTRVVRGDDLLDSAGRQLLLYRALGMGPEPSYTHLPLVLGADGRRLAKRHGDTRVESYRALGVPAEALVGLIAFWGGLVNERRAVGSTEFIDLFDLSRLPRTPVHFTPEDDQWLRSFAR